ncbi:MAG: DUF4276 family protein [Sulfobacillus sp.]
MVVEGYGEVESVPILVRKIGLELGVPGLEILKPIRCSRDALLNPASQELETKLEVANRKLQGDRAVLILLDQHNDCAASAAPVLYKRAKASHCHLEVAVIFAVHEYEAWFLAGLESIRGCRGVRQDAEAPTDPEGVQGAKERLRSLQDGSRYYSPTVDQPAFTAKMDIAAARGRARSLDKFYREVERLLKTGSTAD